MYERKDDNGQANTQRRRMSTDGQLERQGVRLSFELLNTPAPVPRAVLKLLNRRS
jgi:hypothetical protein